MLSKLLGMSCLVIILIGAIIISPAYACVACGTEGCDSCCGPPNFDCCECSPEFSGVTALVATVGVVAIGIMVRRRLVK